MVDLLSHCALVLPCEAADTAFGGLGIPEGGDGLFTAPVPFDIDNHGDTTWQRVWVITLH